MKVRPSSRTTKRMVHGHPAEPISEPVRFSDLPARRTLTSAEVVDLVLAAVAAGNDARPGVEGLPLPGADRVLLHHDGRVTVEAPAPPGDDRQRMLAVAVLLRDLLSLDTRAAPERAAVPGPLLLLLARAFGTIDLPALSFEAFCQALSKFGSPASAASRQRLWEPPTAAAIRRLPVAASPATPASVPERRRQDARAAALRRELRLLDRELFEAHARRSRARGVPLALAVAIWVLAIPAGAAVMWGAVDLLDGTAYPVQAREMDAPLARPTAPSAPTTPTATAATPLTRQPAPPAARALTPSSARPAAHRPRRRRSMTEIR